MPRWDFKCSVCGYKDEVVGPSNTLPTTVCPRCQNMTMERQPSAPNFVLRGAGFHAVDYPKEK